MSCNRNGFVLIDGLYTIDKSEHASRVYGFDLSLHSAADPVVELLAVEPMGCEVVDHELQGQVVLALVKGGKVGEPATVLFRWRKQSGQEDARTMVFNIVTR